MPTVLREGPYRFFFYSADSEEPPHIHIEREVNKAKFWLDPVQLERNSGFGPVEIRRIQGLVEDNSSLLLRSWNEFFESPRS
jgi:hypothetical protein